MSGRKKLLGLRMTSLLVVVLQFVGLSCRSVPVAQPDPEIPPEIARLLPGLYDENPNVREKTLWDLNRLHQSQDQVVREATRLLTDEFDTTRGAAATVIGLVALYNLDYPEAIDQANIEHAFNAAILPLIELFKNKNERSFVRSDALNALAMIGQGQSKDTILPVLIESLAEDDDSMRKTACTGLGSIGAPAATAVPLLTERLRDDSPRVRSAALESLGKFGKDASATWPEMVKMVDDPSAEVRFSLIGALLEFRDSRPEEYKKILTVLSEDDDPYVRELATDLLAIVDD